MKYLILFLLLSAPAFAEDAPKCSKSTAGQVSCMANRMCECKHFHASAMQGTPEGYRWDCGITRPNCLDFNKIEETKPYDGPQSYSPDNSSVNTTINN